MPITDAELETLYKRYAPILHVRCRSILGSDEEAQDAVQETFARVIRHHDTFRLESSPLTWMYQISTNWCLNQLRNRKGRARKHEDHREDIVGDEATAPVLDGIDDTLVRQLLEDEDDETRAIVIHLFFDEMTREDTAKLVGLSVPTLRKRLDAFLRRARRALGVAALPVAALLLLLALSGGFSP